MKVFISQPMRGKSLELIKSEREACIRHIKEKYGDDVEIISSILTDHEKHLPLYNLGESLKLLSEADAAVFMDGWKDARGCKIEHIAAEEYGIDIL